MLSLRNATLEDANLLLSWRNDSLTRLASHNTEKIAFESHIAWLEASLANPMRRLLVAEDDRRPVGMVRLDRDENNLIEVSWTVAPEARKRRIATRMVQMALREVPSYCAIRAEVKTGNAASIKVAEAAGMHLLKQERDVLHFFRGASE